MPHARVDDGIRFKGDEVGHAIASRINNKDLGTRPNEVGDMCNDRGFNFSNNHTYMLHASEN